MQVRVLIVEDDLLQAQVLAAMLESHGFYVEGAATGVEALRKVRVGWFDLVLMDYGLPEVDGFAAARLIATLTKVTGRPRLVALTASPDRMGSTAPGDEHVFDAIEAKPWQADALVATLRRCHEAAPPAHRGSFDLDAVLNNRFGGSAASADDDAPGDVLRVLVAEDDELWRTIVVGAIENLGHHVVAARDGLEALRDISTSRYDVVIVDYRLPEIDGVAAARLIFDIVARAYRPRLIALTASPELLREHLAGQADLFDEVVAKSAGIASLLAAFERCAAYVHRPKMAGPVKVMQLAASI